MPANPKLLPGTQLANGQSMFYGQTLMLIGAPSTRQANFYVPSLRQTVPAIPGDLGEPVIQVTIQHDGSGTVDVALLYNIQITDNCPQQGWMQIGVSSQSLLGHTLNGAYYCHITVIGTPVKRRRKSVPRVAK